MPARRVTLVTHTAETGGAETALLRLVTALDPARFAPTVLFLAEGPMVERFRASGVTCSVIDLGGVTEVRRTEATSARSAPARMRDTWRGSREVADALAASGTELAVAHSLKAAVLLAFAARRARVPWVWHLNDRLASDYMPRPVVSAMRALAGWSPRAVIANSQATKATLGVRGRAKAFVAYPGLPESAFPAATGANQSGPIGLVGRIGATKGQREFVAAAGQLHDERPDLRFTVVGAALFGDGEYEAQVRREAATVPDGAVAFAGWADDPTAEIRRFAVLVHASPVPEPFGQVVVEGMAAGVPVIATRAGGAVEILDPDGVGVADAPGVWVTPRGVLVAPGDAGALARGIALVVDDPAASAERALTALAAARHEFPISRTAAVVQDAWQRALDA